MHQLSKRLMNI